MHVINFNSHVNKVMPKICKGKKDSNKQYYSIREQVWKSWKWHSWEKNKEWE